MLGTDITKIKKQSFTSLSSKLAFPVLEYSLQVIDSSYHIENHGMFRVHTAIVPT